MRIFNYTVPINLEQTWDMSWTHWSAQGNCRIVNHQFYPDDKGRMFMVKHSAGMNSWGENYTFILFRDENNPQITQVRVEISLSFGWGAQWYVPYKQMVKWCTVMGVEPIVFGKKEFIITWAIIGGIFILPFLLPAILLGFFS